MIRRSTIAALSIALLSAGLHAQQASRLMGTVGSVAAEKRELTLKDQAGTEHRITLREGGEVVQIPPGERDLTKASRMEFSGIKTGDRVLARAVQPGEGGALTAGSLVVITANALSARNRTEAEDWRKRGTVGSVTAINPAAREISLKVHGAQGEADRNAVVAVTDATVFRRYAPGSVKFADAKPSKIEEIQVGDQVRALGNKDPNGRIQAETVVSGAFRNMAATVVAVDAARSELKLKDLETKQQVVVRVTPDTGLRKMPEMMATMVAARLNGTAPAGGAAQGRPGGGRFDLQQMLQRLPSFQISELKPGDAVIVAGTRQADAAQLTAITMLAGVEPLFTANPQGGPSMSGLLSGEMTMGIQ